jgi:hypothetical protein
MAHPARWAPEILSAVTPYLLGLRLPVHDPFAGTGERLGKLCDEIGVDYSGTEIEPEFIRDDRVRPGDSTDPDTYPARHDQGCDRLGWACDCTGDAYMIVTSPVYPNGMTDHFEAKDASRRHTYRQGLAGIIGHDRPLHPNNMGRWGNHYRRSPRSETTHFEIARQCIEHWPRWAIVNVKDVKAATYSVPVVELWRALLAARGYEIVDTKRVLTPGQRNGANGHLRVEHEVVLLAFNPLGVQ